MNRSLLILLGVLCSLHVPGQALAMDSDPICELIVTEAQLNRQGERTGQMPDEFQSIPMERLLELYRNAINPKYAESILKGMAARPAEFIHVLDTVLMHIHGKKNQVSTTEKDLLNRRGFPVSGSETREYDLPFDAKSVKAFQIFPDGMSAAVVVERTRNVRRVVDGEIREVVETYGVLIFVNLSTQGVNELTELSTSNYLLALSHDGQQLLAVPRMPLPGSHFNPAAVIHLDNQTSTALQIDLKFGDLVQEAQFSSDGSEVAILVKDRLLFFSTSTGVILRKIERLGMQSFSLLEKSGAILITDRAENSSRRVALLSQKDGRVLMETAADIQISPWAEIVVAPNEESFVALDLSTAQVFETFRGRKIGSLDGEFLYGLPKFVLSSDGRFAISVHLGASEAPGVWELESGRQILKLGQRGRIINSVSYAYSGDVLAFITKEGQVEIWRVDEIAELAKGEAELRSATQ